MNIIFHELHRYKFPFTCPIYSRLIGCAIIPPALGIWNPCIIIALKNKEFASTRNIILIIPAKSAREAWRQAILVLLFTIYRNENNLIVYAYTTIELAAKKI